jgi:hypothetical protein
MTDQKANITIVRVRTAPGFSGGSAWLTTVVTGGVALIAIDSATAVGIELPEAVAPPF